tara:strand:+ start:5242 stop:6165 length:924 start_codon:yes stop_codon:yes gene_type:complete
LISSSKNIINGWLFLDKPTGKSSNLVLKEIKKKFNLKKIGFVGTLDPLASGFLPIAVGKATKIIKYIEKNDKEYLFTVCWGKKTSTADREGDILETTDIIPKKSQIIKALNKFKNIKKQSPPKFSAKKINGQRAYKLAREGIDFTLKVQDINILQLNVLELEKKSASFYIKSSSGTYIRSLAESFSEILGTLGFVSKLRRVGFGNLDKKLISLDSLLSLMHIDNFKNKIKPLDYIFNSEKKLDLNYEDAKKLLNGKPIDLRQKDIKKFILDSSLKSHIIAKYKNDLIVVGLLKNNVLYPKTVMDLKE